MWRAPLDGATKKREHSLSASVSPKSPSIVWFRRDLRLADNPALQAALHWGAAVIPVFILDEAREMRAPGGAARWWLEQSLSALSADLAARGSRLVLRRGEARQVLGELARETGAGAVFWNRLYDPGVVERDKAVKAALRSAGLMAESFKSYLLVEPWELRTKTGGIYSVFTPFWRAARPLAAVAAGSVEAQAGVRAPSTLPAPATFPRSDILSDWRLHPKIATWTSGFQDWRPGEAGALKRLDAFSQTALGAYKDDRDHPNRPGTSRLSPHLHWGEISPATVWRAAERAHAAGDGVDTFLSELGWREFNHHLLFHRPDLPTSNFRSQFDAFPWRSAPDDLERWRRGMTGYPLVDAGMRELWSTGFMHNRVRMVAASFLIKHLLIDWRHGEAWFWDTLLDASPASNVLNWQWVAGSGADAAPFFRIFNPVAQGERFDPDGRYITRWVPEISRLGSAFVHAPQAAPAAALAAAGVRLGETYPRPMVDHDAARQRALAAFRSLRSDP